MYMLAMIQPCILVSDFLSKLTTYTLYALPIHHDITVTSNSYKQLCWATDVEEVTYEGSAFSSISPDNEINAVKNIIPI